jgi:hypothetical protein
MVDLSAGLLGMSGIDGLPERRSLHIQRPCHALHPVLYRHRLSIRTRRRHHPSSRQYMDEADCTQRHRCGRWLSARQTAFDPRPRCEILRHIPHCSRAQRYSRHSIAAAFAQFEFVRGKIRQINKGRVPESINLLWKGIASARDYTIPRPLSPRAKSSRTRRPAAAARRRHWRTLRPSHPVPATRRDAQLLSSRSRLIGLIRFDSIVGQYAYRC